MLLILRTLRTRLFNHSFLECKMPRKYTVYKNKQTNQKKVAFVQTLGKLVFRGDSFSPTRGYLYLADVWGHFLIATHGGQERRQAAACSTTEASPNSNCQTPKRINSKGVKKNPD